MESDRYLEVKRDNHSIHMIRLVRRSRLLVVAGEATNRGLYRLDKDCPRVFGISGIHAEGDEVDCIREEHDHKRRLLVLLRAACQRIQAFKLTSWGIWVDPQKFDHPSFFRIGSLSAMGSLSLSA